MPGLFRELISNTLRSSMMTVGVFLLSYGVILFAAGEGRPSVTLGAFAGMLFFGMLLSLPFSFPLVLAGIAGRVVYNRSVLPLLPSKSLRTYILVLVLAGLGLFTIWLWLEIQGLDGVATEIVDALYIAGSMGGGAAGYYGSKGGTGGS